MEERFIIIIPFYNARNYLLECLDSLLMQTHTNWLAICTDDGSDDGSSDQIPDDQRIRKIINKVHRTTLENISRAIINHKGEFKNDDIICILDGDDKLLNEDALKTVADLYLQHWHCLMTYGNLVASSGIPIKCNSYTQDEFDQLRKMGFRIKPLRTFKWILYKEFMRQDPDLSAYKDERGIFYKSAQDVAMFVPLAEIAGYHSIEINQKPIYWYRRHERNDDVLNTAEQAEAVHQIMEKKPFKMVFEPMGYRITWNLYSTARNVYRWMKAGRKGN
jgi:glycosyltransferase involved in cell wall biosynthesis